MTGVFSAQQQMALMKALARAQYVYALGDQAMAMDPRYIRDSFEKMWVDRSMQSQVVRDTAKWMIDFVGHDRSVAEAFTAPIEQAEKN